MTELRDVRVPMPETELSDFVREQEKQFTSALEHNDRESGYRVDRAKPLIQKVPPVIRRLKMEFTENFEPVQVALGPLHYGNEKLNKAEQTKLKLATRFVRRNRTTSLALFLKIKEEIEDLRKCYDEEDLQDYDDEKLAWMFFVDGCALLETLHSIYEWYDYDESHMGIYLLDLLLLENQLPYRVLKILIGSTMDPRRWELVISEVIDGNFITYGQRRQLDQEEEKRQEYIHLLERMRRKLLSGEVEKRSSSLIGKMILGCGARREDRKTFLGFKELQQSGIRAKPSKSNNIKSISFSCNFLGCLEMPPIVVDDSTASIFMNLVALEKCPGYKNDFAVTSYLCFLGSLIQTAEDVKELRVAGMLHSYFGNDEEVATLFRRMCRSLQPDPDMYGDVTKHINFYCNNWVIWTYSHYFSRNWSVLAFLGAIAGLVLTLLQTYFTIKRNMHNPSI